MARMAGTIAITLPLALCSCTRCADDDRAGGWSGKGRAANPNQVGRATRSNLPPPVPQGQGKGGAGVLRPVNHGALNAVTISAPQLKERKRPAALVAAAVKRIGGARRLAAVKMIQEERNLSGALNAKLLVSFRPPDAMRVDTLDGERVVRTVLVSGGEIHLLTRDRPRQLAVDKNRDLLVQTELHPLLLLRAASGRRAKLRYLGETRVGPGTADAIQLTLDLAGEVTLYLAREGGDLVASTRESVKGRSVTVYSEFKAVSKLRLPHRHRQALGAAVTELEIPRMSIDPKMRDKDRRAYFDPVHHPFFR